MVEVFITSIQEKNQAESLLDVLEINFPELKINVDINETELSFPCGHTILRVEGTKIVSDKIISVVKKLGLLCEILEEKCVCKLEIA